MKPEILPAFRGRDILSIQHLSRDELVSILDFTQYLEENPVEKPLQGKIMASCFFEPSTRTRLSFESAMKRLGGDVIGFAEAQSTSVTKKETLYDTIKMLESYADIVVMRHPLEGSAAHAAATTHIPVINAGDGANQHPTQTLLDLYTIRKTQGKLENLHIAFCGDLKNARTSRSLIQAAAHFKMRMYFVSLPGLDLPAQISDEMKQRGVLFSFHSSLDEIMPKLDVLYMTRIQAERMDTQLPQSLVNNYILTRSMLQNAKSTMAILHPLPRVNEITRDVDDTPQARYFDQARCGVLVRQAILMLILGGI